MDFNLQSESGETEWSEPPDIDDHSTHIESVDPAPAAKADPSFTLLEANCSPPSPTMIDGDPEESVTVWLSNSTGAADPHQETVSPEATGETRSPNRPPRWPTVAGYVILGELGRGSMGVVFKARELKLQRICALKMMLTGTPADLPIAGRFQGEAESLALLLHPNVVQIFTIGAFEGMPYLELEYVEGGSLAQRLNGIPKPPDEAAEIIAALARGVAAIHRRGLVHRDLKPGNVLLAADGTPKVADFGLVKVRSSAETLTPKGSILGSPSYMAPEQAEGKGEEIGPSADIYGLGAILYELLTGRPPFRGATIYQTLEQVRTADPVAPSQLTPGLPRDIETIALKCLQKRQGDRYPTAEALAEDLRRYLAREPILARPVPFWERGIKWARRRPGAAIMVSALAATLLGLLSLGIWSYQEISRHLQVAEHARGDAELARADAEIHRIAAETSRGEAVAETYRSRLNEAKALAIGRPPGWRDDSLRIHSLLADMGIPNRDLAEVRTLATASIGGIDVREVARFKVGNSVRSIDFDSTSTSLATADYGGRVRIWDLKKWEQSAVIDDPACNFSQYTEDAPMPAVRYRPGGGGLVYTTFSNSVEWYDPTHPDAKRRRLKGRSQPFSIAFDARGRSVAVGWNDGLITLCDARTGCLRRSIKGLPNTAYHPVALSPDGDWVATMGPNHQVRLYSADSSEEPITLGRHAVHVRALAFSPDGLTLASASLDETVKLWDTKQHTERATLRGHTARLNGVAFHPDGGLIASASDDRTVRLWDANSGELLLVIRPEVGAVLSVAFSPDGNSLACGHEIVSLFQIVGLHERRRLRGHSHEISNVVFSPHEPHLLVSGSSDYVVMIWDAETGRTIHRWPVDPSGRIPLGSLALSPKGRLVATGPLKYVGIEINPDFSVLLWDLDKGPPGQSLKGHRSPVEVLAFDPDGSRLASGGENGTVIVWELPSGRIGFQQRVGKHPVTSVGFLDGGKTLIAADTSGRIVRYDVASGSTLQKVRLPGGLARCVTVPGEKQLVVGGEDGTVSILRLPDLTIIKRREKAHEGPVWGLAPTPDGALLITGGNDQRVIVRDFQTLDEIFALPAYDGAIFQLAVSPDGARLAVAGVEQRLDLWNLALIEPALDQIGLSWRGRNSGPPRILPRVPSPREVERIPSPIDRAWTLMGKGEELRAEGGHFSEVLELYRETIAIWEAILRKNPDSPFLWSELAVSHASLGDALAEAGRTEESARHLKRAIEIVTPLRDTDPRVALAHCRVLALASRRDPEKGRFYADRAMQALRQALAGGYKDRRQIDVNPDFKPLHDRADFREVVDANYAQFGWPYLLNRGRSHVVQGRISEAIADFVEARKILGGPQAVASDPWLQRQWAMSGIDLTAARCRAGGDPEKPALLTEAIKVLEASATNDPEVNLALAQAAHAMLVDPSMKEDHAGRAIEALHRAVANGCSDREFLETDFALETIRAREDFQGLLGKVAS